MGSPGRAIVTLGLIARADQRGLGILSLEFFRHMKPDRVLVVDVPESPFPCRPDRYPGATVARWSPARPQFGPGILARFLDGLTTVYSAETFYDSGLVAAARKAGVRTVLHAMPEFYRPGQPRPDEVWAPTPWRIDTLPDPIFVPVPVPSPPLYVDGAHDSRVPGEILRAVHVAGLRAAADRNGSDVLRMALRRMNPDTRLDLRVEVQGGVRPVLNGGPKGVLVSFGGPRADRWDLYADADVLVLPRRYGGLCLPAQEAMAAGLAVVMPDVSPNDWWPTVRFSAGPGGRIKAPCGELPVAAPDPTALAGQLDALAADPAWVTELQAGSRKWAAEHSWAALLPEYERRLRS